MAQDGSTQSPTFYVTAATYLPPESIPFRTRLSVLSMAFPANSQVTHRLSARLVVVRDRGPHARPGAFPVARGVVRRRQPEPHSPVVGRRFRLGLVPAERGVGRGPVDPSGRPSGQIVDRQTARRLQFAGQRLGPAAELDFAPDQVCT
jgi:hypothetical protein